MVRRRASINYSDSFTKPIGDIGLTLTIVAITIMMIVPLTPWLIDLLIGVNFTFSLLLICLSLFIRSPLRFTTFPTLILVATLYRLALNISSTRLILLRADAGNIINGFGGHIVGDDILVGAVIFGILALVLFLVITKGAERVAEVAARFSLDALPGLQLAIDADLRQGALCAAEASKRRDALDQKSRYFGALDGAMKFVRGDALAALCIICINIIGGLSIGIFRHDMSIPQALEVYGRLTVGDGLVTMIPALLVSTAAGMLVTRVGQNEARTPLGEQIGNQLIQEPKALGAAAVLLFALASIPSLPAWPFLILGIAVGIQGGIQSIRNRKILNISETIDDMRSQTNHDNLPAVVEIAPDLIQELSLHARAWKAIEERLATPLHTLLGIPIGQIHLIESTDTIAPREARLKIKRIICDRINIPADTVVCKATKAALTPLHILPVTIQGSKDIWISRQDVPAAKDAGFTCYDPLESLLSQIDQWLLKRAGRLIGMDETQTLIDEVTSTRPVLVRETVPKIISLPKMVQILQALVTDGISAELISEILENVARHPDTKDIDERIEQIRCGLSSAITHDLLKDRETLEVLTLDQEIESVIESALVKSSNGTTIALSDSDISLIVEACRSAASSRNGTRPIIVTSPHLRRPFADLLAVELPRFYVVKSTELEPDVPIEVVGTATIT